ncbi:BglG family transcriptional antiterminator [Kineothrix alysoides]|uniref:BglG family transcriptional antiterminator n=1 Tax=Kineothrix alysoides TaxID=1469948 RepID=A0A4R1QVM4_9FIRM|nr:transcription antiterminator [Kineothrix alysoides]TCL57303.1 BglG family transcriptional antiterminator [Kineothrix alysoides]
MNKRLLQEAELLLSKNAYITVSDIATTLSCSNKTVRNDLIILEPWIKDLNLSLDKKIGVGIAIRGDEEIKLKVLNDLAAKTHNIQEYSPEDRMNYILSQLFSRNSRLRIKELASHLYVSRATIHKDLLAADEWLCNYNIKLIRKTNYGIEINGNENDIRNAMSYLICSHKQYLELQAILNEETSPASDTLKLFRKLTNFDILKLKNTVFGIPELISYHLTDEALLTFIVDISVATTRMSIGKYIRLSSDTKQKIDHTEEFLIAKRIGHSIEEVFSITFPPDEIYNLALHILCSKTDCSPGLHPDVENFNSEEFMEAENLSRKLASYWSNTLRLPLTQDNELFHSLSMHLKPVINGVRYGLTAKNPILDEILKYYPYTFRVVKDSIFILEDYLCHKISDDEIGYITLHLASAIERSKKKLKTVVICHGSTGEAKLLKNKLSHEMNELDIVYTKSSTYISSNDLKDIDLIITTVPLKINTEIDVINISSLLNKQDIVRLKSIIKMIYSRKNSLTINK